MIVCDHESWKVNALKRKAHHMDSELSQIPCSDWAGERGGRVGHGLDSALTLLHMQWLSAEATTDQLCPVPASPGLFAATCGLW